MYDLFRQMAIIAFEAVKYLFMPIMTIALILATLMLLTLLHMVFGNLVTVSPMSLNMSKWAYDISMMILAKGKMWVWAAIAIITVILVAIHWLIDEFNVFSLLQKKGGGE